MRSFIKKKKKKKKKEKEEFISTIIILSCKVQVLGWTSIKLSLYTATSGYPSPLNCFILNNQNTFGVPNSYVTSSHEFRCSTCTFSHAIQVPDIHWPKAEYNVKQITFKSIAIKWSNGVSISPSPKRKEKKRKENNKPTTNPFFDTFYIFLSVLCSTPVIV